MGTRYSHLTITDRIRLEVLLRHGGAPAAIARHLGVHRSTVSREIARAGRFGVPSYIAHFGQRARELARRGAGQARRKLGRNLHSPAWLHVRSGLAAGRTPEQIAGRVAALCSPDASHLADPTYVSHETIYRAIYALPRGALRTQLISCLVRSHSGRRRRRRATARPPKLPDMTPIALRPPEVASRLVPGHWEGDLIKGAGNRSAVGTLVERTSRLVLLVKLDGLGAQAVMQAFQRRLASIPAHLRKTLTYDQGSEMALHKTLAQRLKLDIYFCDAHSPWQRGSNENANGRIRRFLPKGIDLSTFSAHDLRRIEFILNNTPRKLHKFRTPAEIFSSFKTDNIHPVALQV